ncbi:MAG: L-asparaginase [Elusimicrobia bacterium]|nr:MAG: L-asparaginase [Elusimicrobiota bacterium]
MSKVGSPGIVVHGGAASPSSLSDRCMRAAEAGMAALEHGASAVEAVVKATVMLEDDPSFNAGTGCVLREDGKTIEADAGLMDSMAQIGGVASLKDAKNPILVASKVFESRHIVLAGDGAAAFAEINGLKNGNPPTGRALARFQGEACDTVGAVARDKDGRFAAASSTGGIGNAMIGRVSDSSMPGCGYWAGPMGAVTATGIGEEIAKKLLCRTVYGYLESGVPSEEACRQGVALYPREISIGLLVIAANAYGWASNRNMAHAILV